MRKPKPVVRKWFVSEPYNQHEMLGTRGISKQEAQDEFILLQKTLLGTVQPWVWWEKQGYRVRKD